MERNCFGVSIGNCKVTHNSNHNDENAKISIVFYVQNMMFSSKTATVDIAISDALQRFQKPYKTWARDLDTNRTFDVQYNGKSVGTMIADWDFQFQRYPHMYSSTTVTSM